MDKKTRSIIILCAVLLFLSITGYLYVSPQTSDEKRAETALRPAKTSVITVNQQAQKQETVKSGEITPVALDKDSGRIDRSN